MSGRIALLAALVAAAALPACNGGESDPPAADAGGSVRPRDCRAGDQAFVRQASLALLGRRPRSQAETLVYARLMEAVRALPDGEVPAEPRLEAARERRARETVARALMSDPAFVPRWTAAFMDILRVQRIDDQSMARCYGEPRRAGFDEALAAHVRDNPASAGGDGGGVFNMRDLLSASIALDDLSPALRGHLFALVAHPIPAANVPAVQAELARREDYGIVFESAYLNRDMVCLGCHNSAAAVTFDEDPRANRHWPLPGLVEESLFGDSFGIDPQVAHGMLRFDGFVDGDTRPWGWSSVCGDFDQTPDADIAGIHTVFGDITGDRATVFDLEDSLRRGVDGLADGLELGPYGEVADPDQAFAYLVAASIANQVWREVTGYPLTIANWFPRNRAQRDQLHELTERFARSHFSLEELLLAVVDSPWFALALPEDGCGAAAYELPNVFNPWVLEEPDESQRWNSPADAVFALGPRALTAAAHEALGWEPPRFGDFPETPYEVYDCLSFGATCSELETMCTQDADCCAAVPFCDDPSLFGQPEAEQSFERGVGFFLKNGERGFRGLDFQARLVWEERFGACADPDPGSPDFVDDVIERGVAGGATVGDAVGALKDRLVGEAVISDAAERQALEDMLGTTLDTALASAPAGTAAALRRVCGVLLQSPQFLLGGVPAPDSDAVPLLTPEHLGFDAVCEAVAARGLYGLDMTCHADGTIGVAE